MSISSIRWHRAAATLDIALLTECHSFYSCACYKHCSPSGVSNSVSSKLLKDSQKTSCVRLLIEHLAIR